MNLSKVYTFLALLLCYGLVIAGFLVFGADMERKLMILDIAVACLVLTQYCHFAVSPLINLRDKAQKDVGLLGIKLLSINVYSLLATAMIVCGIYFQLSFTIQLFAQLGLLLFLLIGYASGHHAANKVGDIYNYEQGIKAGKMLMRSAMDNLMDTVAMAKGLDPAVAGRLEELNRSMRYITPSDKPEAYEAEQRFLATVKELDILLQASQLNADAIASQTALLERLYEKRKRY